MTKKPIGIYDSGVGGLTVLKKLREALPHEDFVYFGDTLNLPYGTKTKEEIISFAHNIISWMHYDMGVKAVVAACHTSSALALDDVSPSYPVPLMGTIYPLVNALNTAPSCQRVGIIATPASVASQTHEKIFRRLGFTGDIISIPCSDFVPLIESTGIKSLSLYECTRYYLQPFFDYNLDTLIYGCTHYPFIEPMIRAILPPPIRLIDPADYMASDLMVLLAQNDLMSSDLSPGKVDFYCSSDPALFQRKIETLTALRPTVHLKSMDFEPMRYAVNR